MASTAAADRVARNTPADVNRRIRRQSQSSIAHYRQHPEEIEGRLQTLNREWDIERLLMTNASSLMLLGLGLGLKVNQRLFALPVVVSGFLLQHALQGWCPPLPIFRRLGFRTREEIEAERCALRAMQ